MNKIDLLDNETPEETPDNIFLSKTDLYQLKQEDLMKLLRGEGKVFLIGSRMTPIRLTLAELS